MFNEAIIAHLKMKSFFQIYEIVNTHLNFLEFMKAKFYRYYFFFGVEVLMERSFLKQKWSGLFQSGCEAVFFKVEVKRSFSKWK